MAKWFFVCGKLHDIKFTILKCIIRWVWYIHNVVQLLPLSSSRTLSPQTETLFQLNCQFHTTPSAWWLLSICMDCQFWTLHKNGIIHCVLFVWQLWRNIFKWNVFHVVTCVRTSYLFKVDYGYTSILFFYSWLNDFLQRCQGHSMRESTVFQQMW